MRRLVPTIVAALMVLATRNPSFAVPTNFYPWGIAVSPNTNRIYVANEGADNDPSNDSVSVIDGENGDLVAVIPVQDRPKAIAVNPATNRVYVGNWGSNSLSVIDASANSVVTTIPVGAHPFGVAINTTTNKVYVTNSGHDTVSVVDGSTHSVTTVPVVCCSRGVGVNSTSNRIYVPSWDRNEVWVVDGATNGVVTSIPVGPTPVEIGVNPTTNRVYVSNNAAGIGSPSVSVLNGATNAVIATIPVGAGPRGIAVNTLTNRIYVANANGNTITVIDGGSNTIIQTIPVGAFPVGLSAHSGTNKVYAANNNSHNVSILFGAETLRNNSFDADANSDIFPDEWSGDNLSPEDRLSTDAYEGRSSFEITGMSGLRKTLFQTVALSGPRGSNVNFEATSKANGTSPTGGQYRIRVDLLHTDNTRESFHMDFAKGSHGWERGTKTHKARKAFRQVTVTIIYADQVGTVLFDAIHLWRN
jgi:YVTN family beta-propeller protein